jgi:ABC-type dipeptide/oligopeptide/nickel transport system ATPase subunit
MQWTKSPQERHVFWLNGLAGTGKSTIAQTFAEVVSDNGTLGASFFCSRDYLDRKELKNIFPTLAYQLACRYPAFRNRIIQIIKQDPSVARNSLMSQLRDLIVGPLSCTEISCVIVVDALDECVDDQPASAILSVLGRFVKQLPSVKFFITGRPEPRIRTGFRLPLLEPLTQNILVTRSRTFQRR